MGLSKFDLNTLKTENEKKAFWMNVYNAFALKIVADNYPKTTDVFRINGFFDLKKLNVAGRELSLSDISSGELRFGKETKDPRINFALTTGAKSAPKLNPEPFKAGNVDKELDECTAEFIRDNVKIDKENNKLELSTIFRWFDEDFKKDYESPTKFVAKYLDKDSAQYLKQNADKLQTDYLDYDSSVDISKK